MSRRNESPVPTETKSCEMRRVVSLGVPVGQEHIGMRKSSPPPHRQAVITTVDVSIQGGR